MRLPLNVHSYCYILLILSAACHAQSEPVLPKTSPSTNEATTALINDQINALTFNYDTPVEERAKKEKRIPNNFAIAFYKPTYIMPYYYTGSPYNQIYQYNTPNNEKISHNEVKYQLSFKVPVWKNIFNYPMSLYIAYTQLSYWQAYNNSSAFFRETDYEPELFIANEINLPLFRDWKINFLNVGAIHQSNGLGDSLERSWNRIYLELLVSSNGNLMISLKPWIVIHDSTMQRYNPNITNYLGYAQFLIAYKFHGQVFSLSTHNIIQSGGKHATFEGAWSFPITTHLNGYLQVFSGYGQSLIEYDHHTNSIGIGISLSNWI